MQQNTPGGHTGEPQPSDPGHRTHNTTHRAGTPVNKSQAAKDSAHTAHRAGTPMKRSQVAKDTAHAKQRTEGAHRRKGGKWPRTPHTQHNTASEDTGEREPGGPGHHTRNTTHRAGRPVNKSQGTEVTAHATQHTKQAQGQQEPSVPGHGTHNTMRQASRPVTRSQVAQDTAHATQHTDRAHW